MKVYGIAKRAVLLTAALLVCAAGWAQNSISALVFDEYEWDFGTLREVDGPVSHLFSFTNTGTGAAVITHQGGLRLYRSRLQPRTGEAGRARFRGGGVRPGELFG